MVEEMVGISAEVELVVLELQVEDASEKDEEET